MVRIGLFIKEILEMLSDKEYIKKVSQPYVATTESLKTTEPNMTVMSGEPAGFLIFATILIAFVALGASLNAYFKQKDS